MSVITPPTVTGPTISAAEITTTTTENTSWTLMKGSATLGSGVETMTTTDRITLSNEFAYPGFWNTYVKQRVWKNVNAPLRFGPLYSIGSGGVADTAKANQDNFRTGTFTVSGTISAPGRSQADCGSGTRLKYVRWRWVRFNPFSPFVYEYAAPPATYHQSFHFLVEQNNRFGNHDPYLPLLTTDERLLKGVIEIDCSGAEGTADWQNVPMTKFDDYKIDDPVNLTTMDFTKWCNSLVTFGTPVDIDFIKPGTEDDQKPLEIANDKEDSEGEVVNVNWDDDNNSEGSGGHGTLVFKNDFDDTQGTEGEDDMIQLKLHSISVAPGAANAIGRLKYDNAYFKIWLNRNRTGEVVSEQTEIVLAGDKIVYLEGKKLTEAESPKEIEMQLKLSSSSYAAGDSLKVHVATPIITLQGKITWVDGTASKNLAEQMHDRSFLPLGKYRRDDRNNTVILKGKNKTGKTLWYSVDMVDVRAGDPVGDTKANRPKITVRTPHLDMEIKMALSLEGAHVFCNGHSNFGLGPNFMPNGTSTIDDYCNLTGGPLGGVTGVILKSDDPKDAEFGGNSMKNPDHGGPNFALRPQDIVQQVTNYRVPAPSVLKFNGNQVNGDELVVGSSLTPQAPLADGTIYHYKLDGEHHNYVTVVKSSGDKPILRYDSCFMAGCNTGRALSETLQHGVLLFTLTESQMQLGRDSIPISGDKATAIPGYEDKPMSWVDAHYVRMMIEGRSWDYICTFLNQNYSFPWPKDAQGNPVTPSIYDHKP